MREPNSLKGALRGPDEKQKKTNKIKRKRRVQTFSRRDERIVFNSGVYLLIISGVGCSRLPSPIAYPILIGVTPSNGYFIYIIRNNITPTDHKSDFSE
jgi:hypothetical protein